MTIRKSYEIAKFKALDVTSGTFEAIVSVFDNVDLQGDRMRPGSFMKSLQDWRASGFPVPGIWSHDWADPFAHIGYADPAQIDEVAAEGDNPAGLRVRGKMDVDKPFAKQVFDLLVEGRVKEWSFAYDVVREKKASDGANDLLEVKLIEFGPTLKGANPDTVTLGVKSTLERAVQRESDLKTFQAAMQLDADLARALAPTLFERLESEEKAVEAGQPDEKVEPVEKADEAEAEDKEYTEQPMPDSPEAMKSHLEDAVPEGHGVAADTVEPLADDEATAAHSDDHDSGDAGHTHPGMAPAEDEETSSDEGGDKSGDAEGAKSGRVVGAKAASALKSALTTAVDEFVAQVNGEADAAADDKDANPKAAEIASFKTQLDLLVTGE